MDALRKKAGKAKRKSLLARVPAGFVQAVLKGHSGLGLAFAAAIYLICLSGSLLVFYDELQWWEAAGAPELGEVSPQAVQAAIAGAVERGGAGVEHVFVNLPAEDNPHLRIYVDAEADSKWTADATGTIAGPLQTPFAEFLSALHIHLHLPQTWGAFVVGMAGVALLSSLFSGILAHPRILRDAFHLRLGGSRRLQEADLHNRIGVWGLPFHLVISLTGALLGLVTLTAGVIGMAMFDGDTGKVYSLFLPPEPVDNPAPAPLIDVAPLFGKAPAQGKLERIVIEHPLEQGAAALFEYRDPALVAGEEQYGFDRSGEIYFSKVLPEATVGERVLGSLGPLHFGWFGGVWVKLAYLLMGLGLTYLAVGGVNIWLARRRDKGRPAPGWERVWAGCVWGQPAAFAIVAAVALAMPATGEATMVGLWLGVTALVLLAATVMSAGRLAGSGKAITGMVLIALGTGHTMLLAQEAGLAVWAIDAALLVTGLGLLASARTSLGRKPLARGE